MALRTAVLFSRHMLARIFGRLRPEEGLFVVAFLASAILTVYANVDLYHRDVDSRRIQGGLLRLGLVVLMAAALPWLERALRRREGSPRALAAAEFFRTILPFVMCIAVYTNLHDTVRYVNSHDIHPYLSRAEAWLFGGQPVLWAEAYITPARTEFFNFFYANFYLVAPSIPVILWMSGRRTDARTVLLGIIVCFYTGYVLYVIFPAAPPRLYYASMGLFKVTLRGGPITNFQEYLIGMMPNHAERAAFPSLHAAISTPQPGLCVALLPLVLPDPAGVRDRAARLHRLPAAPLGGRPARRHVPRAVDALVRAALRPLVADARERGTLNAKRRTPNVNAASGDGWGLKAEG